MAHVNLTVEPPVWETMTREERKDWLRELDDTVTSVGQITAWAVEGIDPADDEIEPALYGWTGWEAEPNMTGDGSGDPDKHFLTINDPEGEEYALIVHRVCNGKFPLDGEVAYEKTLRAKNIVAALNDQIQKATRYHLEMGVETANDGRLLAVPLGPFSNRDQAVSVALTARGQCASEVREGALRTALGVGAPDVPYRELNLPIVGATLLTYVEGRDEPVETDLY